MGKSQTRIMTLNIHTACWQDVPAIQTLMTASAQTLQAPYYPKPVIATALELIGGLEELITTGRFFIAKPETAIIACGGWVQDSAYPEQAEIRSFFVHPEFARQGIATQFLNRCERDCARHGIKTLYLTATLAGEPFYRQRGFSECKRYSHILSNGAAFELVKMVKTGLSTRSD